MYILKDKFVRKSNSRKIILNKILNNQDFSIIATPNPHHVYHISCDEVFRKNYSLIDTYILDSKVIYLAHFLLMKERLLWYPGSQIVEDIKKSEQGKKILIVGPGIEYENRIKSVFESHSVDLLAVGFHEEWNERISHDYISAIKNTNYDVILICLGYKKQEAFALDLKDAGYTNIVCVGAAVDFLIGNQSSAPNFTKNLGLEWLFRLLTDFKRFRKRYFFESPLGLFYFFNRSNNIFFYREK